jgi:hypothetical protein
LTKKFNEVIRQYNTTTLRNAQVLGGYVAELDRLLSILHEVMISIDEIENTHSEDQLPMKERVAATIDKAADMVDDLSGKAITAIQQTTGVKTDGNIMKYAIAGIGTYALLRALRVPTLFCMVGAAGVVMILNDKDK